MGSEDNSDYDEIFKKVRDKFLKSDLTEIARRALNPDNESDIQRALRGDKNLRDADLSMTWQLEGADLSWADLTNANLNGSGLHGTNLSGADLSLALLEMTDLTEANLCGANLEDVFTDLSAGPELEGAKYNSKTSWPAGFDPEMVGAVRVD